MCNEIKWNKITTKNYLFCCAVLDCDKEDHHRVVVAAMSNPPSEWKRPRGRPYDTWLRTVSRDVQPFSTGNTGVHSAWHLAADGIKSSTPLCFDRSLKV